ncbi:MAG: hypothetical protein JJU46_01720 [Balneolaceae bacterium]|nr:hypothetical protein [Balneolaceae bacterium]MCH8550281.1 hypothetical protein [Balneolaceae bacterium]
MGQQQLLLVILVTIIVGIATVVAINTFGSAADSANVDAVRQDMLSIAASSQQFYMRPDMLGGGGRSFDGIEFTDFSFAGTVDGTNAFNDNGRYEISTTAEGSYTLIGHPANLITGSVGLEASASETLELEVLPDDVNWIRSSPGEPDTQ